jgi:hypothetical protein
LEPFKLENFKMRDASERLLNVTHLRSPGFASLAPESGWDTNIIEMIA